MEFAGIHFFMYQNNLKSQEFVQDRNLCREREILAPDFIVEAAKTKLIEHLREKFAGIVEDEVILEDCKQVIWPDASLGCPREGEVYIEVLTSGYEIEFRFGNEHYKMRTDSLGLTVISPEFEDER